MTALSVRIAIISHASDQFRRGGYVLNDLVGQWRERGIDVIVVEQPGSPPADADLAFSHIDLTRVPDEYARLFAHYPRIINGRILDISKTSFSRQVITRDDPWGGPVLIKTDRNFGGMREMQQRQMAGEDLSDGVRRPWRKVEHLTSYPVLDSPRDVPSGVWRNPHLVVEKFLPERNENGEYVLRMWDFLGDRGVYYVSYAHEPVVKGANTIRREVLDEGEIPDSIRAERTRLEFDYGKFDFGFHEGETVLYDINRTPALPRPGSDEKEVWKALKSLGEGLNVFLGEPGAAGPRASGPDTGA